MLLHAKTVDLISERKKGVEKGKNGEGKVLEIV